MVNWDWLLSSMRLTSQTLVIRTDTFYSIFEYALEYDVTYL